MEGTHATNCKCSDCNPPADPPRNFLAEAERIAKDTSRLLAQEEHLKALWHELEIARKRLAMIEGVVAHVVNHIHRQGEHIDTLGAILAGELDTFDKCQECGGPILDDLFHICAWCDAPIPKQVI